MQRVPAFDEELCRPEIPESALIDDGIEPNLINLMVSCWAEEFQERPDFVVIRKVVRSLNKFVFLPNFYLKWQVRNLGGKSEFVSDYAAIVNGT